MSFPRTASSDHALQTKLRYVSLLAALSAQSRISSKLTLMILALLADHPIKIDVLDS